LHQPVVSVGNVGQLAVDVILSTAFTINLGVIHVGALGSGTVASVTGYECYDRDAERKEQSSSKKFLCTSLEVYQIPKRNITIIQQR